MNPEAIDQAIEVLNRIHRADSRVLPALIAHRVTCNERVANDPTVQVSVVDIDEDSVMYEVGLLGIVNGLFGVDENNFGFITAYCDENGEITHFGRTQTDAIPRGESEERSDG